MEDPMKHLILTLTLLLTLLGLTAEQVTVGPNQNQVRLVQSQSDNMVLELTLGHFNREAVQINGSTWYHIDLKKAGLTLESGLPQLPVMAGSVIIPNTARMELSTVLSEYVDIPMQVAPSKGNLTRDIDPDSVPYSFSPFYSGTEAWPQSNSELTEPFILRDYRGITVRFVPFSYFPSTGTLRVYTKIQVALNNTGTDLTNSLSVPKNSYSEEFEGIYENMFLNFQQAKYPSLAEQGRILVIKHNMFDTDIMPWVNWKRQNGYQVDVVDVSVAGPTANNIKTYIQGQYDLNNGLMFVQIVGDAPQVPTLTSGGGGSDPSFALLAGGDSYPDIYVGRFSAQTVTELQTQVTKAVEYERDRVAGNVWLQKAMGIASNEGGGSQGDMGESDQAHMELIRTDLLGYGYTSVDQMYQTQGATAAQVSANLNQGRGFINYVGHGSDTSWVTTGFSNTHVNALTNDNMLPVIVSVACVNGNFTSQTCFAEAWLRAKNNSTGEPTGAVAMYASTVNQGWNPPMRGQDEVTDLLVAEAKKTIGGLYFNGSSKMIEVYGTSGISEYKNWTIFGDASLMVRTKDPMPLTANYNPILFMGMNSFTVDTIAGARVTLSANGTVYGHAIADLTGNAVVSIPTPPVEPMDLTLTITAFNREAHIATVQVLPSTGPYVVVTGMTVTDNNNNQADFGETVNIGFGLNNVGSGAAQGVVMNLSTTSPYLTVLSGQDSIGDIPAETTGGTVTGFTIQIAANAPDQHVAPLDLLITLSDNTTYAYTRNLTVNAPNMQWGAILVDDSVGNNNGRVEAGETVTLNFPINNLGGAQANDLISALAINNGTNVSDPVQTTFTALPAGGSVNMIYTVTFSSQIPVGTTINMTAMVFSGMYSAMQTYTMNVGQVMEGFEGGFGGYDWVFANGNWTTVPGSYNGTTAARSATISHNQNTSMSVTMVSQAAGNISFWKKVSSEQNYDYLKFYINNTLKNQWSGTNDVWSQLTYPVNAGTNTYKWEYVKDSMVSSGDDCAWIDDIIFPSTGGTTGAPMISMDITSLDYGDILLGETPVLPVTINNVGDAVLIGTVETSAPFSIVDGGGNLLEQMNVVIQPSSFLQFDLRFAPSAAGSFDGSLIINTDDSANPSIVITLSGTANPVANDDPILPAVTALKGNYPNPFNPRTTISYSVKEQGPVSIGIFNLKGQLVKTLVSEAKAAGDHTVVWEGDDDNGRQVSSGIYLYKMYSGKYTSTKKMIMMK